LAAFSEREISKGTGLHRKPIRLFRHGETITPRPYQKKVAFLNEEAKAVLTEIVQRPPRGVCGITYDMAISQK
jgi:hypothetical protein